jgi:hypothetical protein
MRRSFSRRLLCSGLICFLVVFGLCVLPAWGQITQGTIAVTVLDPTSAVVPEANLTLQDLATNTVRTAVTGSAGSYTFVSLSTGTYKLTVSKSGFETQVYDTVTVQAVRVTDVKVTLKVGAMTQQIVVSERAIPVLETTSSAISGSISIKQIEQLPITGRDITQLARLVPGYAGGTWNGLPFQATGNNIDGVVAQAQRMKFDARAAQPLVQARLENMEEMTVQTDQLNLNTGFGLSNMQINFVTRRGGNRFHGRVYEDHQNKSLNANSWYNNAAKIKRSPFILNNFGGSVGGPIKKDKLFFFGSLSFSRQPGSATTSNTFLTSDAQSGKFTWTDTGGTHTINVLTDIAQPNGLPYTVNAVTSGIFSEINGGLGSGKVTATDDPIINEIGWTYMRPDNYVFPTLRVDYNVRDNVRMYFSWNDTKRSQPNTAAPPFPGSAFANRGASNKSHFFTASLGFDWTITPTIVNTFRGGYLYNMTANNFDAAPLYATQPEIAFPIAHSGHTFNIPVGTYYPLVTFADNVTWQHGAHTVNFGFSMYREQDHYYNPEAGWATINIALNANDPARSVFATSPLLAAASNTVKTEAENLYAILTGRINSVVPGALAGFALDPTTKKYKTTHGRYDLDELQKGWGLFFQDSWRVKPTLTLNYGLRWDFTGDAHDLTSAYHSADPVGMWGPAGVGNIFKPGTLTTDPAGLNPAYRARSHVYNPWNVSPQPAVGIAWNPKYSEGFLGKLFGGSNTVIRAGASLRRFTPPYQFFWNSASNQGYAFYQSFTLNAIKPGDPLPAAGGFYAGTYALGDPQPAPYLVTPAAYADVIPESTETFFGYWSGVNGLLPTIKQPYIMSWNLGIQRALGQSNVLEVRYIGNRSVHQWVIQNPNEINIFENGFLTEFQRAQANLAINAANGIPNSFVNSGLPGQFALPIMTTAGVDPTDGTFLDYLRNGQAGDFAGWLAGGQWGEGAAYLCNLIGSVGFSPCLSFTGGVPVAGAYPLNFFQVNPFNAGKASGWQTDAGWGNYHALQVDLRQKPWHGMQFDVNWTWSHALGVQPNNSWTGAFNMFTMRDLRMSYGPTAFDYRHVIHANGTYDFPFGKGKRFANQGGAVDKIAGGWNLGTIINYLTGAPYQLITDFNAFNGPSWTPVGDRYGDGGVTLKGITQSNLQSAVGVQYVPGRTFANVIDPKYLTSTTNGLANPSYINPNTVAGTMGYHPWLSGPHAFTQNLAITKSIPIRENLRFSFQAEFINVWNHPVWGIPGNAEGNYTGSVDIQSTGFGHSGAPRTGQRAIELRANIEF